MANSTELKQCHIHLLSSMDLEELRELWRVQYMNSAGDRMASNFLRQALAHKIQVLDAGISERSAAIRRKAMSYERGPDLNGLGRNDQNITPGTRFLREYKGVVHEVLAIDAGRFVHGGKVFRSLSAVASAITGARTAGTVFFGLNGKKWRGLDG